MAAQSSTVVARGADGADAAGGEGDAEIEAILPFFTGNPRIERLSGTIRLFRPVPTSAEEVAAAYRVGRDYLPPQRGTQLCVLAVPSYMTPADFCAFVGPCIEHVVRMRILHDASPEKYMVLMRFATQSAADEFHTLYNCKPFSSLDEAERCLVVFARSVDLDLGDVGKGEEISADSDAAWEGRAGRGARGAGVEDEGQVPGEGEGPGAEEGVLTELPGCPVCLERLDVHVSGIVTTSCNHSFHTECLSRWSDSSCPVCRYCAQQPSAASQCERCGSRSNLWICVICGHVGCGRYGEGHGLAHFKETNHCYAMEVETQNVWDYVGDNFVHRLIENGRDGKIVELRRGDGPQGVHGAGTGLGEDGAADTSKGAAGDGGAAGRAGLSGICRVCEGVLTRSAEGGGKGHVDGPTEGKGRVDGEAQELLVREYNALLTSQLEEQRMYFEGLLENDREAGRGEAAAAEVARVQRDEAMERARTAEAARGSLESKLARSRAKTEEVVRENGFLKDLNNALVANQQAFQASIKSAEAALEAERAKTADLKEQVRDLMLFLEGGRAIAAAGGTAEAGAGGSISVGPQGPLHSRRKPRK